MSVEIERKFLVNGEPWLGHPAIPMQQGYLASGTSSVRVRITKDNAWLTIKGPAQNFSRNEYEYEIPLPDAAEMLHTLCGNNKIKKTRYLVPYEGFTWEVDVFEGNNAGLVVAEIELPSESTKPPLPPWISTEVTHDYRYRNSSLLTNPWPFN